VPVRRIVTWVGRRLPHGWRDFWLQFAVFWTFNLAYEASRGLSDGARDVALANGRHVIAAERALGIYWEHAIQDWALRAPGLVLDIANQTYFNCQFTISFAFMLWVYFRRNHAFYFVRNTILFADFIGLAGYLAIPTAPPRFLGFVDTLETSTVNHQSGIVETFANKYAAMPSLHTAYALTLGVTGALVCRRVAFRLIWILYPGLVVFSIVATGNHFLLDAVAGACVAAFAGTLSLAVARGRTPRRGRPPVGFLVPTGPAAVPVGAD
jgi:membrane-associated phospholipid phosphatase